MKAKKMYFMACHLAGREYHDADEVWNELKVGTELRLERDIDNHYDPTAVAVMYDTVEDESGEIISYKLGYIPSDENKTLAALLEMGWDNIFETRINKIDPAAHYEHQIHLTIRILPHKQ